MSDVDHSAGLQEEVLRYLDGLYGYAMTLTRSPTEADDLMQETYTQAAPHVGELKQGSNLKGWLFTIMRNIWLKQLRHVRGGPEFVAFDDDSKAQRALDTIDDPQVLYERIWEREEIRMALEHLPNNHREVIILRDIEGFSYKEMAELLDCPVGTIMSRLARARARLKRSLLARQNSSWGRAMPGA
ncbi:MAG: RNA polymerase sigma factor [Gammaproteobacteria bacterium]